MLPELLPSHRGEFALWKDDRVLGFYATYEDAYAAGLDTVGLDAPFLVGEIVEREPQRVSVAWQTGVMFAADD